MWKTKFCLDLHHRTSTASIWMEKTVEGAIIPPTGKEANVYLEPCNADIQSVSIDPDELLVTIRSKYVNYELVEEMEEEAALFVRRGWNRI